MIALFIVILVVILSNISYKWLSDDLSKLLYSSKKDTEDTKDNKENNKKKKKTSNSGVDENEPEVEQHPDDRTDEEIDKARSTSTTIKETIRDYKNNTNKNKVKREKKKKRTYIKLDKNTIKNHAERILNEVYNEERASK